MKFIRQKLKPFLLILLTVGLPTSCYEAKLKPDKRLGDLQKNDDIDGDNLSNSIGGRGNGNGNPEPTPTDDPLSTSIIPTLSSSTIPSGTPDVIPIEVLGPEAGISCGQVLFANSLNLVLLPQTSINISGVTPTCLIEITPPENVSGATSIEVGTLNNSETESREIEILISNVNLAPSIDLNSVDYEVPSNSPVDILIIVSDPDSPLDCSTHLSFSTSNKSLLPLQNGIFSGTAPNCVLTLTPNLDLFGASDIEIFATDGINISSASTKVTVDSGVIFFEDNILTPTSASEYQISFTINTIGNSIACSNTDIQVSSTVTEVVSPLTTYVSGTAPNCILNVKIEDQKTGNATLRISVNYSGKEEYDDLSIIIDKIPPGETLFLSALSGADGEVELSWYAPSPKEGGSVTEYLVFRDTSNPIDLSAPPIAALDHSTLTYGDSAVLNGTPYYYTVVATNEGARGPHARPMRALPLSPTSPVDLNNIHVSPTGNDTTGDGSISNPFQSLSHALGVINPEGYVYFADGTYTFTAGVLINKAVTLQSITGNYRTSSAVFTSATRIGIEPNASNISVYGIEFVNISSSDERTPHYLLYANCYARDMRYYWFSSQSPTNRIDGGELYGNRFENMGDRSIGDWYSIFVYWDYGIQPEPWLIHRNEFINPSWNGVSLDLIPITIKYNYFSSASSNGLQIYSDTKAPEGSGEMLIYGNTFNSNDEPLPVLPDFTYGLVFRLLGNGNDIDIRVEENIFTNNHIAIGIYDGDLNNFNATVSFERNFIGTSNQWQIYLDNPAIFDFTKNYWESTLGASMIDIDSGSILTSPYLYFEP